MNITVGFRVNGAHVEVAAPAMKRLLDVLREDLGLTGTKCGCGEGECGACAVRLDGEVVLSCLVPLAQVRGREVVTVEGLGEGALAAALAEAFQECGAAQCGICTPGMLLSALAHLEQGGALEGEELREALAGNLCRCTGYACILEAVRRAGEAAALDPPEKPRATAPHAGVTAGPRTGERRGGSGRWR